MEGVPPSSMDDAVNQLEFETFNMSELSWSPSEEVPVNQSSTLCNDQAGQHMLVDDNVINDTIQQTTWFPPSFPQTMVQSAGSRDPFWNHVEEKDDGSMICKFCPRRWANKIPISRFKWHLSGEEGHGVVICHGVTKEVQEEALKAMRGGIKIHKSTTSSIIVNDRGISTCPQEQNIENENIENAILLK